MTAGVIPEDWPFARYSRFEEVRPYRWHIQELGSGPLMLLLHGAGASTHSFRGMIPHLSNHFRIVALDLPGHGFTAMARRSRMSLDYMAEDISQLLVHLGDHPEIIVGHSAGAAIGAKLCSLHPETRSFIALNGAFEMFEGLATWAFPFLAKLLALNPLLPYFVSTRLSNSRVAQLLKSTGSEIDPEGVALYHRLLSRKSQVEGVLAMMASWSLSGLRHEIKTLATPSLLLTGENDRSVPPRVSQKLAAEIPQARYVNIAKLGHIMHEEASEKIARYIHDFARETGVISHNSDGNGSKMI